MRNANLETTGGRLKTANEEVIIREFRQYEAGAFDDIILRADANERWCGSRHCRHQPALVGE